MKAALEYVSKVKANKKIAVLGDVLELGEFSKQMHEKIGEEVHEYGDAGHHSDDRTTGCAS